VTTVAVGGEDGESGGFGVSFLPGGEKMETFKRRECLRRKSFPPDSFKGCASPFLTEVHSWPGIPEGTRDVSPKGAVTPGFFNPLSLARHLRKRVPRGRQKKSWRLGLLSFARGTELLSFFVPTVSGQQGPTPNESDEGHHICVVRYLTRKRSPSSETINTRGIGRPVRSSM